MQFLFPLRSPHQILTYFLTPSRLSHPSCQLAFFTCTLPSAYAVYVPLSVKPYLPTCTFVRCSQIFCRSSLLRLPIVCAL
ncbi:hypothetical protein BJ508DRAFT_101549 [Ascobolus immersus RN42]|uniref:Uncharacterized protein n=1 Tax=Ascobolus immersus RN42 TaxID=1160509 RepID=A0A3N4HNR5_ASCIM|nr:hypothetical protein BJ508DRAFT_101549 [Ascobolus immersus RN42]